MTTGIFDVRDRDEVFHPGEIEASKQQCIKAGMQYIKAPDGRVVPLAVYEQALRARWQRAVETNRTIENMRRGYCTITPNGSPPASDARH